MYYAATGNHGDLVPELCALITLTLEIDDLLTESIADSASSKVTLDVQGEGVDSLKDGIKNKMYYRRSFALRAQARFHACSTSR